MRKTLLHRLRTVGVYRPAVKKWLILTFSLCIVIKLASAFGADIALEKMFCRYINTPDAVEKLLHFESWPASSGKMLSIPGLVYTDTQNTLPDNSGENSVTDDDLIPPDIPLPDTGSDSGTEPPPPDTSEPEVTVPAPHPADVYTLFDQERLDSSGIELSNNTDYEIDIGALLNEPLNISVTGGEPTVLIVHTHSTEAYSTADGNVYEESDPWRTADTAYSVVRVGDELAALLEGYGIGVVHDRSLHDYPAYNGAYNRSLASVSSYLEQYPSIKLVIDLHRDAIMDANGTVYKTVAQINDTICSQILLVVGTNFSGLDHPHWQENMKLALRLQYAMNELYPSLAKPIHITQYRYNQHMTTGSLIVEVGCNGNTLSESLDAVAYFADAAASVVLSVTEKEKTENLE